MSLGVVCWKCKRLINEGEVDMDAPKYAHKDCELDATIRNHDINIRRHEIGKMKALMRKYAVEAIAFMRQSNEQGR